MVISMNYITIVISAALFGLTLTAASYFLYFAYKILIKEK